MPSWVLFKLMGPDGSTCDCLDELLWRAWLMGKDPGCMGVPGTGV